VLFTPAGRIAATNVQEAIEELDTDTALAVLSDVTGITGADRVTNIVSLTQAEYDALIPDTATLYVILG
jgi:ABC-type ATPase with predicted acetyltransferase domain